MYLVVCTYPNFSINKMLQRAIYLYDLKAVYKISTGRKYYEFYVEMSQNCSILASIFQKFPGGGMPPDTPSSSMRSMLESVLCTPLLKRLVP